MRAAGECLRGRLADLGLRSAPHLEARRGYVELGLSTGGRVAPLDRVPRSARFLLTLDLLVADAIRGGARAPVLLLDGPGRAFRKERRRSMRSFLEDYVRIGATLLYSSRLPFEIELQHPEQVLVLAPTPEGPRVARAGEPKPDLAVRAALGMTGRRSFRVDDLNLVVEGQSDAAILEALAELLRRSGEPSLPADVHPAPAGGSHEVVAVAAFLGRLGLGAVGLLDSDDAGRTARRELEREQRADPRLRRVEVVQLGAAAGLAVRRATIEDLFPPHVYLEVARAVLGPGAAGLVDRAFRSEDLPPSAGRAASRLARVLGEHGRRFPKTGVAEGLAAWVADRATVDDLPTALVGPVRRLMESLRAALDRSRAPEPATSDTRPGGER